MTVTEAAVPTLVLITGAAVLAPFVVEGLRRFVVVPEVVVQIVFGIILGPFVLKLTHPNDVVSALSDFGLTYLMFLAGIELDLSKLSEGRLRLATQGWVLSVAVAFVFGGALAASGLVRDWEVFALCLTTTALGTLLPILRDAGALETPIGRIFLSVGAIGEFGPVVAVAVLLTTKNAPVTVALLAVFVVIAVVTAVFVSHMHSQRFVGLMRRHLHTTSQLPVRVSVFLVVVLVYLTQELGLDVLLGSFAAGIVVRLLVPSEDAEAVTSKLQAIGFGVFIPVFFIVSGTRFDLSALVHEPVAFARVPLFLALFLVVRGTPALLLYRRVLVGSQRRALALWSSAGLPMIVVITTIGVSVGRMSPVTASALVAAGMLSVLVFPTAGLRLAGSNQDSPQESPPVD